MSEDAKQVTHSGFVAIIGRPNVGKSTLLNALLGQKLAIATRKPQTTRHTLLGVDHVGTKQIVYVDTPGIHQGHAKPLNRYMNKVAQAALIDVDVILFVLSGMQWTQDDELVQKLLQDSTATEKLPKVILVINKVDLISDKERLLPFIAERQKQYPFADVLVISAKKQQYLQQLKQEIVKYLPQGPAYFPEDQITNRDISFLAAEMVREQLILQLGQELPYVTAVTIENIEKTKPCLRIAAIVWVAKDSQKPLIIGKSGQSLKRIATSARLRMQEHFKQKVFLQVWVKVKKNWTEDKASMRQLGLDE